MVRPLICRPLRRTPMKLYFAPGACSLSPHIVLQEAGIAAETEQVNNQEKKTKSGTDYWTINPKGQVPALQLDSGELVTEGPVIVQMIADKAAGKNLAPAAGSAERYKLQEWLNFITTELHKNFSPLFQPVIPDEVKNFFRDRIKGKFKYVDSQLSQDFLMGKQFSVADGYLYVMLRWAERVGMDLSEFKNLMAFKDRVAARPSVKAALDMEAQAQKAA